MKKIVTILGARPQFIKGAVLSREISKFNDIEEVIVHTGQHYDANMSAVFFDEMKIPQPKYNLAINGLNHGAMTGQMLEKIEAILVEEKPDAVVVFGDTNSTLAGALAAKKLHIKIVHVEAGLRSFNMKMPEEVNRIVTDRISDLLICPTQKAIENLQLEGFSSFDVAIENHGDIMKDAMDFYSVLAKDKSTIFKKTSINKDNFLLATIHRQENTDDRNKLSDIFKSLDAINEFTQVVMPLHPRTKKKLSEYNIDTTITLIDPVGYFDMIMLLTHCKLVATDSGGLQKEAFFNQKHCIIVREETEWIELVNNNFAQLTGPNSDKILDAFHNLNQKKSNFNTNLYGDNVGEKIYTSIKQLIQ